MIKASSKTRDKKRGADRLYGLANFVIKVFGCMIFALLVWYALIYIEYIPPGWEELTLEAADSPGLNLLWFAAAGAVLGGLMFLEKKLGRGARRVVSAAALITACLWIGAWSFWWILSADRVPVGDQAFVYGAASYFREGNFYFFGEGGYLGMYPYQLGIISLMELLFMVVGPYNYFAFEVLCALMAVGVVFLGGRIVMALTESMAARVFYCLGMMGCIPLILYTSWVYGDLPSIFFMLLAFDALIKYEKRHGKGWLVLLAASGVFMMLFRQNSRIFLVALVLAGMGYVIKKRDFKLAAAIVLAFFLPSLVYTGIYKVYEIRSGEEKSAGLPYVSWIAMGMQESRLGSGWYNNYPKDIYYEEAELDLKRTAEIARAEIGDRVKAFRDDPSYAAEFYKKKILSQWDQPLYEAVYFNTNYEGSDKYPKEGGFAESVSAGNYENLLHFADRMQFVIYAGVLLYFVFCVKRDSDLLHHVPAVALIGGFLFSIVWEAKARYVFPYYIMMYVVAATGYFRAAKEVEKRIGRIRSGKRLQASN